jgi:uncharacterized membrane protein
MWQLIFLCFSSSIFPLFFLSPLIGFHVHSLQNNKGSYYFISQIWFLFFFNWFFFQFHLSSLGWKRISLHEFFLFAFYGVISVLWPRLRVWKNIPNWLQSFFGSL